MLIKKYGANGTHLEQQKAALERLQTLKPTAPPPVKIELEPPKPPAAEAAPEAETAASDESASSEAAAETPAGDADEASQGG